MVLLVGRKILTLEDRILAGKLRRGDREVFCRVYQCYRKDLLRMAASLLNDFSVAEDVVHDVFCSLIRSSSELEYRGSLKGYFATYVANRARNICRERRRKQTLGLEQAGHVQSALAGPVRWIIRTEEFTRLVNALAKLPAEQREVIVLYLQGEMVFRQIAKLQDVSTKTVQSRYRYGLNKLRSILGSEVMTCDQ